MTNQELTTEMRKSTLKIIFFMGLLNLFLILLDLYLSITVKGGGPQGGIDKLIIVSNVFLLIQLTFTYLHKILVEMNTKE